MLNVLADNKMINKASSTTHTNIPGTYIVLGLLALTAIVGSLFIHLSPKATEKSPGVLHVGIRYSNEKTIDFMRYHKQGPGAKIEFIAPDGTLVYTADNLGLGRNLVPIKDLENGAYIVRISAEGFHAVELTMIAQGRMLNPPSDAQFEKGTFADYNMIGVLLDKV